MPEPMPTCPFCGATIEPMRGEPAWGRCPTAGCDLFPYRFRFDTSWRNQRGAALAVKRAVLEVDRMHAGRIVAERERIANDLLCNGCFTGDCPHGDYHDCVEGLRAHIAEWATASNRRASATGHGRPASKDSWMSGGRGYLRRSMASRW